MATDLAEAMREIVGEKGVFTDARSVAVFSRDAFYYSPVLKAQLEDKLADLIVAPQSVAELQKVVSHAAREGIPVTLRGAGTGNYGQCVPLHGGIVVSTHRLNRILDFDETSGVIRVEAGVRMGQIERYARERGWELRCYPSTWATAAIGGFVGGGFGGVGSIRNGVLWDGFLKSITVLEMTEEAKTHTLEGHDVFGFIHAYGTSGIMVGLEVEPGARRALGRSRDLFPRLRRRAKVFPHQLALDESEAKRLISLNEWPIPSFFRPLVDAGGIIEGQAAVLLELAEGRTSAVAEKAAPYGGKLTYTAPASAYHKGKFCLSDFSWNHTTLWAMKTDPGWTYLQSRFSPEPEKALEQISALRAFHGDKVAFHHEYIRQSGELVLAALDLIHYQEKEPIYAAIARREELGIQVADPHTFLLDADPRWGGEAVLAAKARYNPHNLLNPGKISSQPLTEKARSW